MKINAALVGIVLGGLINVGNAAAPASDDPFIWLEEVHSERALNWVKAENAKTDGVLERDPRFQQLFHDYLRRVGVR